MQPITQIAAQLGISQDYLVPFGHHKAKISLDALEGREKGQGKLGLIDN